MLRKIIFTLVIAAVSAVAIYCEFVLDARAARRADLKISSALGVNVSMSLLPLNKISEEMRAKYGDNASVTFTNDDFKVRVTVNGRVVREVFQASEIDEVLGFVGITEKGAATAKFPFSIGFEPEPITRPNLSEGIRNRFSRGGQYDDVFSFSDTQWSRDPCQSLSPGGQYPGASLVFGSGTSCIVRWDGTHSAAMLVTVTRVQGDPWVRPFSKWFCRFTVEAALAKMKFGEAAPDYATCVLVDRPLRHGASQALVSYSYSVDRSRKLALID